MIESESNTLTHNNSNNYQSNQNLLGDADYAASVQTVHNFKIESKQRKVNINRHISFTSKSNRKSQEQIASSSNQIGCDDNNCSSIKIGKIQCTRTFIEQNCDENSLCNSEFHQHLTLLTKFQDEEQNFICTIIDSFQEEKSTNNQSPVEYVLDSGVRVLKGYLLQRQGFYFKFPSEQLINDASQVDKKQCEFFNLKFESEFSHFNKNAHSKLALNIDNIPFMMTYTVELLHAKPLQSQNNTSIYQNNILTFDSGHQIENQSDYSSNQFTQCDFHRNFSNQSQIKDHSSINRKRNRKNCKEHYEDDDQQSESITSSPNKFFQSSTGSRNLNCKSTSSNEQPKKNVVKNIMKAFRSFIISNGNTAILMNCLQTRNIQDIFHFREKYMQFQENSKFNNSFVKLLLSTEPFKAVFHHFVNHSVWDWLEQCNVGNKKAHKQVLNDYVKATKNLDRLESIHSLRSRQRTCLNLMKSQLSD